MNTQTKRVQSRIGQLNDALRRALPYAGPQGRVVVTRAALTALEEVGLLMVMEKIREFDSFNDDNDPYGEHDFGKVTHSGSEYFFKIDYYDAECKHGSEDPAEPAITTRVMTIMTSADL